MKKIYSVEEYIEENHTYRDGLNILRELVNSTEVQETIKWSAPVYTINGKNVLGLFAFKNYFGIWFFNGVFLKDEYNLLVNAQENKTKALRQIRFTTIEDVDKNIILSYINEAIENQKLGKELKPERNIKTLEIPSLLEEAFNQDTELRDSFKTLTPYKQREYCDFIALAKRESTKANRLHKIRPLILSGLGLNDKYKNC